MDRDFKDKTIVETFEEIVESRKDDEKLNVEVQIADKFTSFEVKREYANECCCDEGCSNENCQCKPTEGLTNEELLNTIHNLIKENLR